MVFWLCEMKVRSYSLNLIKEFEHYGTGIAKIATVQGTVP